MHFNIFFINFSIICLFLTGSILKPLIWLKNVDIFYQIYFRKILERVFFCFFFEKMISQKRKVTNFLKNWVCVFRQIFSYKKLRTTSETSLLDLY